MTALLAIREQARLALRLDATRQGEPDTIARGMAEIMGRIERMAGEALADYSRPGTHGSRHVPSSLGQRYLASSHSSTGGAGGTG